ncbi:hypothetical protein [Terriglobus albidus]|uniref:hypothetical protein n=1 Tax=Terriglobus albidus TaxID=1592106 RepID=UPI0021E070A7|nr:hypothetical protein [Terriglobus albidus]
MPLVRGASVFYFTFSQLALSCRGMLQWAARAFSLLLGIQEEERNGVFIAENAIDAELLYTCRENAPLLAVITPLERL